MKRILSTAIVLLILGAVGLFAASSTGAPEAAYNLTILHINDYHGKLLPFSLEGEERGGLARIASIIEAVRKENDARGAVTLFLVAGDVLTGSRLSNYFQGEADITALNLIKPDAMVPGNHEFDYGLDNLKKLVGIANYPIICSNVTDAEGHNLFKNTLDLTVQPKGGEYRIAIFGLVTPSVPDVTSDPLVSQLDFADPIATAKKIMTHYARKEIPQPDLIIALTHIGYDQDKALAEAVGQINVIVGGHSHTLLSAPTIDGNTIVVTAHEYGKWVGRLDLKLAKGQKPQLVSWQLLPVNNSWQDDPAVKTVIDGYAAKQGKIADRVLAKSNTVLVGNNAAVRTGEATFGDLVCDLIRARVKTDIVLVNAGTFRSDLAIGDIKLADLMDALPFDNNIVTMKLPGSVLLQALEHSIASKGEGPFLQVSGISVVYEGGKVSQVTVGGSPLDAGKIYTVATSAFMGAGKDGYTMLLADGMGKVDTGLPFNDVVVEGMEAMKDINVKADGRLVVK